MRLFSLILAALAFASPVHAQHYGHISGYHQRIATPFVQLQQYAVPVQSVYSQPVQLAAPVLAAPACSTAACAAPALQAVQVQQAYAAPVFATQAYAPSYAQAAFAVAPSFAAFSPFHAVSHQAFALNRVAVVRDFRRPLVQLNFGRR